MSLHPVSKYPIVDLDPSSGRVISNFTTGEILLIPTLGFTFGALGFFTARLPLRAGNTRFTAGIGLSTALFSAYCRSCDRLMGATKNDREVAYYGALTPKEAAHAENFDSTILGDFLDSSEQKVRASKPSE